MWRTCHWWADRDCTISSNEELQWYPPEGARVAGGRLRLTAQAQAVEGSDGGTYPYRSGTVSAGPSEQDGKPRFEFTYGRAEARTRLPEGDGLWSAFWLLPSTTESRPEIDIMEVLGNDPAEWMFDAHPKERERKSEGTVCAALTRRRVGTTIGIEWEPGSIRWFLDGDQVWSIAGGQVPDEPMYLVLNLAAGGEYAGPPTDTTQFRATFAVDQVTVSERR